MTHTETLEGTVESADTSQFAFWALLFLVVAVALVLFDDQSTAPSKAALGGAIEDAGEGTVDGVEEGRDGDRGAGTQAPLSPLGERLLEIRREIVASGQPLLSWEDLDREIAERRGEVA